MGLVLRTPTPHCSWHPARPPSPGNSVWLQGGKLPGVLSFGELRAQLLSSCRGWAQSPAVGVRVRRMEPQITGQMKLPHPLPPPQPLSKAGFPAAREAGRPPGTPLLAAEFLFLRSRAEGGAVSAFWVFLDGKMFQRLLPRSPLAWLALEQLGLGRGSHRISGPAPHFPGAGRGGEETVRSKKWKPLGKVLPCAEGWRSFLGKVLGARAWWVSLPPQSPLPSCLEPWPVPVLMSWTST